jgi:hypothetical protein
MPREDVYSLKEMIQEVRDDNRTAIETQATILSEIKGICSHLERLNSKVATHELQIAEQKEFKVRAMTLWAVFTVAASTVASKVLANF